MKKIKNWCYVGTCKHGRTVFGAIANTAEEQADCARDVKQLVKQGFTVELVAPGGIMPDWCEHNAKCKKCPIDNGQKTIF